MIRKTSKPESELTRIADRMLSVLDDFDPDIQAVVVLRLGDDGGMGDRGYENDEHAMVMDLMTLVEVIVHNAGGELHVVDMSDHNPNHDLN